MPLAREIAKTFAVLCLYNLILIFTRRSGLVTFDPSIILRNASGVLLMAAGLTLHGIVLSSVATLIYQRVFKLRLKFLSVLTEVVYPVSTWAMFPLTIMFVVPKEWAPLMYVAAPIVASWIAAQKIGFHASIKQKALALALVNLLIVPIHYFAVMMILARAVLVFVGMWK